jgi:uncharacterized membrane-anchored protein YitT (DUF2179 family)
MPKSATSLDWRSLIFRLIFLTIAALIGSLSVVVFLAPFEIAPSGISGIAVILNQYIGTPIGLLTLLGNIPIQYLAFRMLGGWQVVAATVYIVIVYSIGIDLLAPIFPKDGVSEDVLLNALFGGIISGVGSGLAYRAGATFGGTSTLSRILQARYGTPMSSTYLYTNLGTVALAGLVFGWDGALYATVALALDGAVSDYVLEGPSVIRTAVIITDHPQTVADAILHQLQRGVTGWEVTGMFTGQTRTLLYVTVARPQINDLRRLVGEVDPGAFIVVGQGHVAYGRGFQTAKPKDSARREMLPETKIGE